MAGSSRAAMPTSPGTWRSMATDGSSRRHRGRSRPGPRPVTNVAVALDAKQTWIAEFASSEPDLAGPAWLRPIRKQAIARFEAAGLPTQKHEDWRVTNLAPPLRVPFKPAPRGEEPGDLDRDVRRVGAGCDLHERRDGDFRRARVGPRPLQDPAGV